MKESSDRTGGAKEARPWSTSAAFVKFFKSMGVSLAPVTSSQDKLGTNISAAAWADGNIRVGDYILLIDSDTRVPSDCLLDAVSEMEQSPEVGIMQFSSGVMQVVHTYFENGIVSKAKRR